MTANEKRAEVARLRRDALADLIAEGREVHDAGTILGMSNEVSRKLWMRIRHDLGWQAQ